MTNREWLEELPTKELAKWIGKHGVGNCDRCEFADCTVCGDDCITGGEEWLRKWLEAEHKEG